MATKIDFELPKADDEMLLVGAVFAEATANSTNADEKRSIGYSIRNMAYYAGIAEQGGKKCYNSSFGNGTTLSAIKNGIHAYDSARWKLIMDGDKLKSKADLENSLSSLEVPVLKSVVEIVKAAANTALPATDALTKRIPVQFNQAENKPPSDRQEQIFKYGSHTFYGFKTGRECQ